MSETQKMTKDAGWSQGGPLSRDLCQQLIEAKVAVQSGDVVAATTHLNNAISLTESVAGLEAHVNIISERSA